MKTCGSCIKKWILISILIFICVIEYMMLDYMERKMVEAEIAARVYRDMMRNK